MRMEISFDGNKVLWSFPEKIVKPVSHSCYQYLHKLDLHMSAKAHIISNC